MFGFLTSPCSTCNSQGHSTYRAHFCGLCNCLRKDYGLPMRFLVNRDAAFLSLLGNALHPRYTAPVSATCCNPFAKPRLVVQEGEAVSFAAAITICGLQAKLDDEVADCRSRITGVSLRGARGILSSQISKAELVLKRQGFPFDEVQGALAEQTDIEKYATQNGKPTLEELSRPSSFSFGKIVAHTGEKGRERLKQIGESLGRVIYTMDAWVDLKKDRRKRQFNPFLLQPSLLNAVPKMVDRDLHMISSAMQDLSFFHHQELLELILGQNLQRTCASILAGNTPCHPSRADYKKRKNSKRNSSSCCDGFNICDIFWCCDCGDCDGVNGCADGCCDCDVCCCDCG